MLAKEISVVFFFFLKFSLKFAVFCTSTCVHLNWEEENSSDRHHTGRYEGPEERSPLDSR